MAKRMSSIYRLPAVFRLLLIWIGDSSSLIVDGLWGQPLKIPTPSRPYALHGTSWSRKLAVHRAAATTCRTLSPTTSMEEALAESAAPVIEESSKGGISSRKSVVVARGKARLFWEGNPLVFGGSIAREEGNPMVGDIVDVVDASGKFIAWGVYNPDSMYRVRVLAREGEPLAETRDVETLVRARIRTARDTRRAIGLPSADTNTYRLVNGEGDRLSGLVVDVFDNMIGVSSSAVWVERFRPEIEAALRLELGANRTEIVWRRSDGRLQQDGWKGINRELSVDLGGHDGEQEPGAGDITVKSGTRAEGGAMACADWSKEEKREGVDGNEVVRCVVQPTVVRELGLEYAVRLQLGQKTGFYCDQRESRDAVRKLSQGRTVLDMFCYSGGFALNAAIGGALRVLAVDSSQPALEEARINAARNRLDRVAEFVREDALVFMKRAAGNGDRFGVVVLDPPKLAPNKKSMANATSRYRRLNAAALDLVEQGGILATFTCSAAMTQSGTFVEVVQSAAASVGRTLTLLRTVGPAADHVTNPCYPEGAYLMGAFFYVS